MSKNKRKIEGLFKESKVKQGDLIKFFINDFGSNGEGVGKYGESYVYVPFALPGEYVAARVAFVKKSTLFATAKEILKPSENRVVPPCGVYGKCGGCQLQHAAYDAQLEFKRKVVKDNLEKIGGIRVAVNLTVASPKQWGYRNKVQFPVAEKNSKTVVGFFKNDTHTVVPMTECPLQGKWAADMADAFLAYAEKTKTKPYDEKTHTGVLRHLTGRFIDGQLLVTVVVNGNGLPQWRVFADELGRRFDDFGLFVNFNKAKTNVILGAETEWLCGRKVIQSEADGVDFFVRPSGFFQVNFDVMRLIYDEVKRIVKEYRVDVLVDCFSGPGVLSAGMYQDDVKEYALEICPSSVADANDLKEKNGLKNLTNICGDVAEELPKIFKKHDGEKIAVVLDPPRKGIDKSTAELLLATQPDVIVYVSCDSATLARDLRLLTATGVYEASFVQPYDMFPQTKHVETLVVLSHKKPDGHIGVTVEFGEEEGQVSLADIEKRAKARAPKKKTTYKDIQHTNR